MRHRDARQRLTQKPAHARMLKRNLVTSLLLYESIRTTKSRAKAIQPIVDRLLRNAKKQKPHVAIRAMNRLVTDKNASRKVMEVFIKRFADRTSGYTRMKPAGVRGGDGALLVDLSFVDFTGTVEQPDNEKVRKSESEKTEKKEGAKDEKVKKATPKKSSTKKTTAKKSTTKKPEKKS